MNNVTDIFSKSKQIKKYKKIHCLIMYSLFFLLLGNFASNYIMYQSCKKTKQYAQQTTTKLKSLSKDKTQLICDLEDSKNKNQKLQKEYQNAILTKEKAIEQVKQISKQNQYLSNVNKEIIKDNVAFESSLKKAAAVGVAPQNYSLPKNLNSRGLEFRNSTSPGKYLGKFLGTAYTPSKDECGNNKGITNSGKPIIPGMTIAVDKRFWPLGSVFYIKGIGHVIAMDTGSAIKGKNRFDFAVFDKSFANRLGSSYWDVYLVKLGSGTINNL